MSYPVVDGYGKIKSCLIPLIEYINNLKEIKEKHEKLQGY
jgi:hypothetical protein